MKIPLIMLGLAAAVAIGFGIHSRAAEATVWQELARHVPAQALTSGEIQLENDAVVARFTLEHDEVGHVQLADGDIWRFAFRSHHFLSEGDSYSVFSGPLGTFRVKGGYFCCEVQFPDNSLPKDSAGFLAFLRQVHKSVEPAP